MTNRRRSSALRAARLPRSAGVRVTTGDLRRPPGIVRRRGGVFVGTAMSHPLPSPCRAAGELVLADGSRVRTRPIKPADRDALADGFARLSAKSRYRRFLGPKPTLSARELTYLTEVDHVTHEAVVAFDEADGRMVGVARYAVWPGIGRHRRHRRHGRRRLARPRPRLGADRARRPVCARERHQAPDRQHAVGQRRRVGADAAARVPGRGQRRRRARVQARSRGSLISSVRSSWLSSGSRAS